METSKQRVKSVKSEKYFEEISQLIIAFEYLNASWLLTVSLS